MVKGKETLESFIAGLELGQPSSFENITVFPLRRKVGCDIDYLLSDAAISSKKLTVQEVSEGGSVPNLMAINQADKFVLLLDGEELRGSKQNRILNTSVLLDRHSKTNIPVSCVEQGRWSYNSAQFSTGGFANTRLRSQKAADVTESYSRGGGAQSDQNKVWDEVACSLRSSGVDSRTSAMSKIVESHHDKFDECTKSLSRDNQASGVIVAINDRFAAMDCFDKPQTLEKIWNRIMSGYIIDSLCNAAKKSKEGPFDSAAAAKVLEHVKSAPCSRFKSAGLGEDWRFKGKNIIGQALVAENSCLHICAFPKRKNPSKPKLMKNSRHLLADLQASEMMQADSLREDRIQRNESLLDAVDQMIKEIRKKNDQST